jgi:hypothetical protein
LLFVITYNQEEIMKKSFAIFLYVVATIFLCGNALALNTYIPHITTGANDWTDYLQVNNNASSTATFTLTLYGSTGAQIYSQDHSVGGLSSSLIELKALNSSAATGKITCTEAGLVFRVSYESTGGGVAEFKTIDALGSNIGFYFSDFTTLVKWKGAAIANMGTTSASVTFYALGGSTLGSGGSILATHTETIAPKAKIVGNNFNLSCLNGLDLSQIESIIAVAGSSSLCGIAISGDMALSRLLFTPATTVSNFNSPEGTSDPLLGNFKFVYKIISTFTDRITLDKKSGTKTSEGTDIYTGYDAEYSFRIASGAWYPSLSKYIVLCGDRDSPSFTYDYYRFTINSDNTLPGCWKLDSDEDTCYDFIVPASHKTPLGTWDMPIESTNDLIDINEIAEKKIAEDQQAQAQRAESSSSVDGDLVSKINELKALIENHR